MGPVQEREKGLPRPPTLNRRTLFVAGKLSSGRHRLEDFIFNKTQLGEVGEEMREGHFARLGAVSEHDEDGALRGQNL
jgi:hypothetical protein